MSSSASPLQNRVTPWGDIIAIPQRGTLMGNRGCLHDAEGVVRYRWKGMRWITCRLENKGNKQPLRAPGRYTPLFFKDEVSALAAGHRPCAQCRREAYRAFVSAVENGDGYKSGTLTAPILDQILHEQRTEKRSERIVVSLEQACGLPPGTILEARNGFMIASEHGLKNWSWSIQPSGKLEIDKLIIVTPPSVVRALSAGYEPTAPSAL